MLSHEYFKLKKINKLCSKPVYKMKIESLTENLLEYLNKSNHCGYEIVTIILDGTLVNSKLARNLLSSENPNDDVIRMELAELKVKPHFAYNGKKRFILFCLVHVIKCMRNSLFKKKLFQKS